MALGSLAALAMGYFGVRAWLTYDHPFGPNGEPALYWGLTPDGQIYKQSKPGTNPYTALPLKPASHEYLILIRSRLREPMQPVDAAGRPWFDWTTGWPLLWYARDTQGRIEFFPRPGHHPLRGGQLQEVTQKLYIEWYQEQAELKKLAEERAAKELQDRRKQEADGQIQELTTRNQQLTAEVQKLTEQKNLLAKLYDDAVARNNAATSQTVTLRNGQTNAVRRLAILDRRAREAAVRPGALEWLQPHRLIQQVSPHLDFESFDARVFDDEFAWRRFRYTGRISWVCTTHGCAWFEPVTVGGLHCKVVVSPSPEIAGEFQAGRNVKLAGTVTGIRFEAGLTNIHGVTGRVCVIQIGQASRSSDNAPFTAFR